MNESGCGNLDAGQFERKITKSIKEQPIMHIVLIQVHDFLLDNKSNLANEYNVLTPVTLNKQDATLKSDDNVWASNMRLNKSSISLAVLK
ncbi:hypothetical protein NQ315_008015 [Exocentrus adspersus]|uniref:Uncharacterized protein n=1 Tax=Exocentrus adspersus TaxID=1586481 RepID=A0AAV8VWR1_9CUCU|nr:hypothetical protein NQ315_008015 [Exocentrus adspersus]